MNISFKNSVKYTCFILLLNNCGKDGTAKKSIKKNVAPTENSSTWLTGLYKANFVTINSHVNGTLPGSATVYMKDEKIQFYLRLFAGKPRAWHQQAIRLGKRCPTKDDDKNKDGFIDINEADAVWGKIITPLDSDPGSQNSGKNFYPLGDLSGSYWYERIVKLERFMNDLKSEDKNPEDNIVKIPVDQNFDFENKVVSILGIDDKTPLPETVGTQGKKRSFQNLPIACGVFEKVSSMPGGPDVGITGPIGEVIPGQDREGDPVTPTGTVTNSRGSGTNENEESETTDENGNHSSSSNSSVESGNETSTSTETNSETVEESEIESESESETPG